MVVSLLACAGVVLATSAAGAQTSPPSEPPVTLVSNLDELDENNPGKATLRNDHGQAFTTGRHHYGYVVSSVSLNFATTSGTTSGLADRMELSIWSASGNGSPAVKLGVLATPESVSDTSWQGVHVFTAPVDGIRLDPGTTYVLVLNMTSADGSASVLYTTNTGESSEHGWTIANSRFWQRAHRDGAWTRETGSSLGIEVAGREAPVRHTQLEAHIGPGDDPVPTVVCVFRGWGVATPPCYVE